jgi:hypothetical protein
MMNLSTFFNHRLLYFFSILLVCTFSTDAKDTSKKIDHQVQKNNTTDEERKRYLTLMLLNLPMEGGPELDLIRAAKAYGMNSVYLTIPWHYVYFKSPTDPPNWKKYDDEVALATSLGLKIAFRIHVARNLARISGFWDEEFSQRTGNGEVQHSGYGESAFQFNHEPSIQKAAGFVTEVLQRYKHVQEQNNLLFVNVTNTSEQEAGYNYLNLNNGTPESNLFDYSPQMIKGFQIWLESKYKKIERLNYLWGTNYKSFNTTTAPYLPYTPYQSFKGRYGKDWYIYRHIILKEYNDKMIATVKAFNPNIKYVADYGSVFDELSVARGTLGFKDLNAKTDGIKINDQTGYTDHRFSVDIIKSESPAHFMIANEVFYNSHTSNDDGLKQINQTFEHGADLVTVLISTTPDMQRAEPMIRHASALWVNTNVSPIQYAGQVDYKLSMAVEHGTVLNLIHDTYRQISYANSSTPRPVRIRLEEDLFSDAYWKDAENHAPFVFRPIPMEIIAIDKAFTYTIPTDTFSDNDGTITSIQASQLPDWLKYENNQLIGKPTVLGDYRIQIQATDDEGAKVEAFFTIRVDTKENANKPPVVGINFFNQMIAINTPYTYTIPENTFIDKDGTITKIEITEKPAWLEFQNNRFSGTPTTLGTFKIGLKAYDDLNAFVETSFTINVVEPQFLNIPPYVLTGIPTKFISVNYPFSYHLPDNIFGDSDGHISSIAIQNSPSWLEFSENVFSGIPPEEGEYHLLIRAFDNYGAYAETTFTLVVEQPRIRFQLLKGGRNTDQQVIQQLQGGEVFIFKNLPALINISATGNFDYDRVDFDLKGPYNRKVSTNVYPYCLYENQGGLVPYIGRYTLTVSAISKDATVTKNTIQFSITTSDVNELAKDLETWQFYPNPIENVFNVKLPDDIPAADLEFTLVSADGRKAIINSNFITMQDQLANIDLSLMNISSGIYIIQVRNKQELLKTFRIFRR